MQGSVLYKYICAGRRILMLAAGKLCELGSWARHIVECDRRIMHRTVYFPRMLPNFQLGPYQVFFRFFIGNAVLNRLVQFNVIRRYVKTNSIYTTHRLNALAAPPGIRV